MCAKLSLAVGNLSDLDHSFLIGQPWQLGKVEPLLVELSGRGLLTQHALQFHFLTRNMKQFVFLISNTLALVAFRHFCCSESLASAGVSSWRFILKDGSSTTRV